MNKFKELLEKLNGLNLIQKSIDWAENLPDDIWENDIKGNFKEITSGLDVDTHRHYETSISVIEVYGKLLGITHITNLFSESSSCEDCYVTIKFSEMKEVKVISYESI